MDPNSNVPGPDDWSDPSKKPQMNPLKPILWMTLPFVVIVLWGYLFGS